LNILPGTVAGVPINGVPVAVSWPVGSFQTEVVVLLTPNLPGGPVNQVLDWDAINVTLDGFDIWVDGGDSVTTITMGWVAIGT
jgi:hypothetical protein